jgi:hypothetical protein
MASPRWEQQGEPIESRPPKLSGNLDQSLLSPGWGQHVGGGCRMFCLLHWHLCILSLCRIHYRTFAFVFTTRIGHFQNVGCWQVYNSVNTSCQIDTSPHSEQHVSFPWWMEPGCLVPSSRGMHSQQGGQQLPVPALHPGPSPRNSNIPSMWDFRV